MTDLSYINSKIAHLDNRLVEIESRLEQRINRIENRLSQIENDVRNKADTWQLDDEIRNVRSDLDSLAYRTDSP